MGKLDENDLYSFESLESNKEIISFGDNLLGALLSSEELDFIEQSFETFHEHYADLPYHNIEHHKIVMNFCLLIAHKLGKEELAKPLILAASTHDIGYDVDYKALGFPEEWTKEDYSIHLLEKVGSKAGLDAKLIEQAKEGIDATKISNENFSTDIRKILRAADIRISGLNYSIFEDKVLDIKEEYEMLHNALVPMKLFVREQAKILRKFLTDDHIASVPNEYYGVAEGVSFYEKFKSNIDRFEKKYG